MSLLFTPEGPVEAFLFPEDDMTGKDTFLKLWDVPCETWIRAYAFTLRELVQQIEHSSTPASPQHIYVDKSCCSDPAQRTLIVEVAKVPSVDVTIGTSPAGEDYISHAKTAVRADGQCWMGSWNFSESASSQVNHAFLFVSEGWRNAVVGQFNRDVAWAWEHERDYQIMDAQPAPRTAH